MGEIPVEVSQGEQLHEFFLQQNAFQGTIPLSSGNLTPWQNLDLGNNKLNGSIPGTRGGLTNLETFNVSENNLQGLVPTVLTTRFNASSFAGIPLLRGTPLTGSQAIDHHHSSGWSTGAIVGMDVGGAGLLSLIILPSILWSWYMCRLAEKRDHRSQSKSSRRDTYRHCCGSNFIISVFFFFFGSGNNRNEEQEKAVSSVMGKFPTSCESSSISKTLRSLQTP
ncbi:unnamed protein product [Sphagnum balticum]